MGPSPNGQPTTLASAVRRHRRAVGMSQERLAERSGLSVRTIRNIEGGRVRVPRLTSVAALADALGIGGDDRERFVEVGVANGAHGEPAALGRGGLVPAPLTPLVGRAAEVEALSAALSAGVARLVTVTGVAGVGKSRLALEVARRLQLGGRRTWWVPLASIADLSHVLDAVAGVVGASAPGAEAIVGRVGPEPALLGLDNLEHLDGVGEVLVDLLAALPAVRVLATSRAPIGVVGEQEWPLQPLAVPAAAEVDPAVLASVGSVQLLVDRVRAELPGFELTGANGPVVAEICRLLDGLPLAVELAARQWRVRGGTGLARSIRHDPLALRDISDSAPPGHDSLLSALQASYELLANPVRRTFERLSVFPAGWDVDAALAVGGGDGGGGGEAVVEHLAKLIALGLVVASGTEGTPEGRFCMLPTIRAFALTTADDQETADAAARHASHFHRWLEVVWAGSSKSRAVLEAERDNLRAALDWYADHRPRAGLEIALLLSPHWRRQGRDLEGLAYFERLIPQVDDPELVARAQLQGAILGYWARRYPLARRLAADSLASHRTSGDRRGCAEALGVLGTTALVDDPLGALAHCRAAVDHAEPLGDPGLLAWLRLRLAVTLGQLSRLDEAIATAERALELVRQHDHDQRGRLTEIDALVDMAEWRWLKGAPVDADHLLESAAPLVHRADDLVAEAHWLAARAVVSASLGDVARTAAAVAVLDERATATGSSLIKMWAVWARGELHLVKGARDEATVLLRQALEDEPPAGYPLNRTVVLAGLAVAATDSAAAAQAISAADCIFTTYGMPVPPLVATRLDAARHRWNIS